MTRAAPVMPSPAVALSEAVAPSELVFVMIVGGAVAATVVAVLAAVQSHRSSAVVRRLVPPGGPSAPPGWFLRALESSGLSIGPDIAWAWSCRLAVAAALLAAWRWPQVVLAVVTVAWVARHGQARAKVRRARRRYDADLAAAIDSVVSRLATGTSLTIALEEVGDHQSEVGTDLAEVVRRHRHGQALQRAIDHWAGTSGTAGSRMVADSLAIAGVTGGSQRGALLSVQATLREREALAREVRALGSQARTSAVVLAATPVGFAAVVAAVDQRVAAFFATPGGWACVLGGLVLDAVGTLWMNRLTDALA